MSFLVKPLVTALAGTFLGNIFGPKQKKPKDPPPPPDAPIQPSQTAANERARRSRTRGRGVQSLVLSPLGGAQRGAGPRLKSRLGGGG